jgi:hypothetical protein
VLFIAADTAVMLDAGLISIVFQRGACSRLDAASFFSVLRYFEWVPFDPRGIRGER